MNREEAIEIVKKNWPEGRHQIKEALEFLVPELKESEDERIRKMLIDVYKRADMGGEIFGKGITYKQVIAWLEKQKDKRELDFAEGKVEGVKQTCQEIKDAMSLFEPKDLTPFELTFRDYIDSAIRYCLSGEGYQQYIKEWAADLLNIEKQKEQKQEPIFEVGDKVIWDGEEFYILDVHKDAYNVGGYLVPFSREGELHPIGQKPAEWSEEDERLLTKLMTYVDIACFDRECNGQDVIDWLKSLRPHSCCELDTETRDALNEVINFLASHKSSHYNDYLFSIMNRLRQQLKSCKPHWKPSEHQLEVLKLVAEKDGTCLMGLYNELKTL